MTKISWNDDLVKLLVGIVLVIAIFSTLGYCQWDRDRLRRESENNKAVKQAVVIEEAVEDFIEETDAEVVEYKAKVVKVRDRGVARIREAAQPQAVDEPEENKARRVYDSWRTAIVELCPACAPGGPGD